MSETLLPGEQPGRPASEQESVPLPIYRSPAVEEACSNHSAPTPPWREFVTAYENDQNVFWYLSCGHHMNLIDEAIELLHEADETISHLQDQLALAKGLPLPQRGTK